MVYEDQSIKGEGVGDSAASDNIIRSKNLNQGIKLVDLFHVLARTVTL